MTNCNFVGAWVGPCGKTLPCNEHANRKCCSCGEPATHECDETGQFVCGFLLCDNCEHRIFEDGTNGGVGFTNKQPTSEKRHCKKSKQEHKPWYMR